MEKYGVFVLVMLFAVTVSVSAEAVFVENHSLEEPGTGKPTWDLIPGWNSTNDALGGAETGWGPTDGDYTAFMEIGCQAYNLTDHIIGAGTEYTLTFDMRKTWAGASTTVDLYYDDGGSRVPMASLLVEFAAGDTTDMEEHTITIISDDAPDAIGKQIGLQVTCGEVGPAGGGWIGFDYFRLDAVSMNVIPIHPLPGATLVGIDDDLSWSVKDNWNIDVYFTTDPNLSTNDPNFSDALDPVLIDTSGTTYDPGTLEYETTYYWRLDAYEPNSIGTGFIIHTGPAWSFTTAPATPTITHDLITQTVALGSTVEMTIKGTNIDSCVWYKDDEVIPGQTGITLTIEDAQVGDEGYYSCDVINTAGSDTSAVARLMTQRLIGWWKLDGNLDDSVADAVADAPDHPGTATTGDPNYVVLGVDGSAIDLLGDGNIVIIENSAEYFNFYPNGYTVSAWVKNPNSGWGGIVGKQNEARTPDHGWVLNHNGDTGSSTLRQTPIDDYGVNAGLRDGEWHLVTGVFDAEVGQVRLYADGEFGIQSDEGIFGISESVTNVVIGAESTDGASPLTGLVDDVRIWNYPLDAITIALLYTDYNPGSEVCIDNPQLDITGPDGVPDCRVDLYELAEWAAAWLECNIAPTCIP